MHLELTPEQAELLRRILENQIADLRLEIAHTDTMEFRELLKRNRDFLQDLVLRLRG